MTTAQIQIQAGQCQYLYNPLIIILSPLIGQYSTDTILLTRNIDGHPIRDGWQLCNSRLV